MRTRASIHGAIALFAVLPLASAQTVNTGLPLSQAVSASPAGTRWVTLVSENGQVDRNGDGDKLDDVWVVIDDATLQPIAAGLASSPLAAGFITSSGVVYHSVVEASQGNTDFNGDGDNLDSVPIRFDVATATTTVFAPFVSWLYVAPDESRIFVTVRESPGSDLNGDGDTIDLVLHEWTAPAGPLQNRHLVVSKARPLPNGDVLVEAPEAQNSQDWNLDGDTSDVAIRQFRAATNAWINTNMVGVIEAVDGAIAAISEVEGLGGSDVNGDGDSADRVIGTWNGTTLLRSSTGLDGVNVTASGGRVFFVANESKSGATDLDGDGDALDRVLVIVSAATGATTLVGEAKSPTTQIPYAVSGNRVAYNASEPYRTSVGLPADLNGDGDALDFVMTVRDLATGTIDRGRATTGGELFALAADHVAYDVKESAEGNTDLDANGTTNGLVFCVERFLGPVRPAFLGQGYYTAFSAPGGTGSGGRLLGWFTEASSGIDHNGDGDLGDIVAIDFDLAAGTSRDLHLSAIGFNASSTRAAIAATESSEGADLNGDGDLVDTVLQFVSTPPGQSGVVANYGSGCPTSAGKPAKADLYGEVSAGGRVILQVSGAGAGSTAIVVLGSGAASIPVGLGCPLLTAPVFPTLIGPLPMTPNGLLGSTATLFASIPPGVPSGATVFLQAFFTDPVVGVVPSDGVSFTTGG